MPTPNQLPSQPLSGVVPVTVIFNPPGATGLPFNQGLICGNSPRINSVTQRVVSFTSTTAMTQFGFLDTDPEFIAAELYFDQSPAPNVLWVGRQDLTAIGAVVVATTPISGLTIGASAGTGYAVGNRFSIAGVSGSIGQVTAEAGGIPSAIEIVAGGTGASVGSNLATTAITGTGTGLEVNITSVGTGGGSGFAVGDLAGVVQIGAMSGVLVVATETTGVVQTLSIQQGSQGTGYAVAEGIPTTPITGSGTGLYINIAAVGETPVQAVQACRAATPLWYVGTFVGSHQDGTLTTNADYDAIALFIEGANPPCQWFYSDAEPATLAGQVSSLPGFFQAESYRRANTTYSTMQGPQTTAGITSGSPTVTVNATVANQLQIFAGANQTIYVVGSGIPVGTTATITGTTVTLSENATLTNASAVLAFGVYQDNQYLAAALIGRVMGLNTESPGSYFSGTYKNIIGIVAEPLSTYQASLICGTSDRTATGLNCNVVVNYAFGAYVSLWQFAIQASGNYFDEILQLDMLANNIQTTIMNYFATALAVPITDAAATHMYNLVQQCMFTSQAIGFIANAGTWQGITVGTGNAQVTAGQALPQGFFISIPPVSSLSQQQLANRQLPPITIGLIEALSGIHQAVIINVQP